MAKKNGKKKRPARERIDAKSILVNALVDLIVGIVLLLISKVME